MFVPSDQRQHKIRNVLFPHINSEGERSVQPSRSKLGLLMYISLFSHMLHEQYCLVMGLHRKNWRAEHTVAVSWEPTKSPKRATQMGKIFTFLLRPWEIQLVSGRFAPVLNGCPCDYILWRSTGLLSTSKLLIPEFYYQEPDETSESWLHQHFTPASTSSQLMGLLRSILGKTQIAKVMNNLGGPWKNSSTPLLFVKTNASFLPRKPITIFFCKCRHPRSPPPIFLVLCLALYTE